jgi:hypothetical protein
VKDVIFIKWYFHEYYINDRRTTHEVVQGYCNIVPRKLDFWDLEDLLFLFSFSFVDCRQCAYGKEDTFGF